MLIVARPEAERVRWIAAVYKAASTCKLKLHYERCKNGGCGY